MARILVLSSYVAHGHVGLSAALPALQRLGHEVIGIPTVVLSNHPGHEHTGGQEIDADRLEAIVDALEANGRLEDVQAVHTGYLPTTEHVRVAVRTAARVSRANPQSIIYCDPILGDDPGGLYVSRSVATAIRDELLPVADMAFPNRFELEWLTGVPITDALSAMVAATEIGLRSVLATSIPGSGGEIVNLLISDGEAVQCPTTRLERVPHGTGDLLAALFIGHSLNGGNDHDHLGRAVAGVAAALSASTNHDELRLALASEIWSNASPYPINPL